ncbi:MAG: putative Ig domain-containing protein [Isosphaeraceae bacterium]
MTTPAWPSAPTNPAVHAVSATENDLSWGASPGATSYEIQRSLVSPVAWTTIATVGGDQSSYSDTSALQGESYEYRVVASNAAGSSAGSALAYPHSNESWRPNSGFASNELEGGYGNGSCSQANLGFSIEFGGQSYSQCYVYTGGFVAFGDGASTVNPYTVEPEFCPVPIIGPFINGIMSTVVAGTVTYGTDIIDGHPSFGVNWNGVGANGADETGPTDSFQLVLIDRSNIAPGAFQIEFNFDRIEWDNGAVGNYDVSGFWDGTGAGGTCWRINGSGDLGAFLDSNPQTGLACNSFGSDVTGRYDFPVIGVDSGVVVDATPNEPYSGPVAGFDDPACPDGSGDYTATVDWGDGSTSPGIVSWDGDMYEVDGDHTYTGAGSYPLQITVTPVAGGSNQILEGTAAVSTSEFTLSDPGPWTYNEGDATFIKVSYSGGDGYPVVFDASGLPAGLSIDPEIGVISGTIAPGASAGSPYNVTVTAYDNTNAASTTFALTVGLPQGGPQVIICSADMALSVASDTTQPPWSWEEGALLNPGYWVNQLDLQAGTFIIRRNSGLGAPLTVYFQLDGYNFEHNGYTYSLDDYTATFGPGGGYVDDSTGQGYVVIPAGEADATVTVEWSSGQDPGTDGVVHMSLLNAETGNQFGGPVEYYPSPGINPSWSWSSATIPTKPGPYTVKGKITYGANIPVRFALVRVYETSGSMSRELGQTYTKDNGTYSVNIPSDFHDGSSLTVVVSAFSSDPTQNMQGVEVASSRGVWSYTLTSNTLPTLGNPVDLSVCMTNSTTNRRAFWVYDAAVTAGQLQATMAPYSTTKPTMIDFPSGLSA